MHRIKLHFLTATLSSFVLFMNCRFLIVLDYAIIYTLTNANILVLDSGVASGRAGRAEHDQTFLDKKIILIFLPLCYLKSFS